MFLTAQASSLENPTLDDCLLSGGDGRLALDPISGLNVYGCSLRPRHGICDFSSSTASSISERAYRRAESGAERFSKRPDPHAFEDLCDSARADLKACLGLNPNDAEVVFSPSGTDAQLLVLFLTRAMAARPVVTIIVGADQTGSGTVHTSRGLHFIARRGIQKGDAVAGLAEDVRSIAVPFCDDTGKPFTLSELDELVTQAAATAIAQGAHVMLQAMSSSKLGWAAPSAACLHNLQQRWRGRIQVVMDACQMRVGMSRLRDFLARGYMVLVTGSKFFCGPAFSGALLVPASIKDAVAAITRIPSGLQELATRFDWPSCWPRLQSTLSPEPNIGQWLRWEAALEEMRAYRAVPLSFRVATLSLFAQAMPALIAGSTHLVALEDSILDPDPSRDDEFCIPTIFPLLLRHQQGFFTTSQCALAHRALNKDISPILFPVLDAKERQIAARRCHIGQPVALGSDRAVLRMSSSARIVTECWSPDPAMAASRVAAEIAKAAAAIEKLELVARHFSRLAV